MNRRQFVAAAGDYAANDGFSDLVADGTGHPFIFAGAARVAGGSGWIVRTAIDFSVAVLTARVRIHFFNAAPTTTVTEMRDYIWNGGVGRQYPLGWAA